MPKMYPGLNEADRIQECQVWLYHLCAQPSAHMEEWECPLWDHQLARDRMGLASDNCR